MECGADQLTCQILTFLVDNELLAAGVAATLGEFFSNAKGPVGQFAVWIKDHIANIISLVVGSIGIWKWWRYRESILHKRLEEYLAYQDNRLDTAREDLVEAMVRPSPGQKHDQPIFADSQLKSVLRERRWDVDTYGDTIARGAMLDLAETSDRLQRRIDTSEVNLKNLREQLATAYMLDGAISAARAPVIESKSDRRRRQEDALAKFKAVQQFPGDNGDLLAKELEAHQLRMLGSLDDAFSAYQELEVLTQRKLQGSQKDLLLARTKTYQAAILQAQALANFLKGNGGVNGGSQNASTLLAEAESLFKRHKPLHEWNLIDLGKLHYLRALTNNRLGFNRVEKRQLKRAERCFTTVLSKLPGLLRREEAHRRLRKAAKLGQKLTKNANDGQYDFQWLLPLTNEEVTKLKEASAPQNPSTSNNPQQPTEPVGAASGDQGIQEAPKQSGIDDP